MAATKLGIYNKCLTICGERRLASLSEDRDPRRVLDSLWDANFINFVLSRGQWNFAARTISLTYSPSVTPAFGMTYAFDKPTDFIRTMKFCSDERLEGAEINYQDHPRYWFADLDTVYVQYVSNDAAYGNDLSLWPAAFEDYVGAELAARAVLRLSTDKDKLVLAKRIAQDYLGQARSLDAMESPTQILRDRGTWRGARSGGWRRRYDRAGG